MNTTEHDPMILAKGLLKTYKNTVALAGLSFRFGPGRIVGLIGPNGAGKTTALKAILGLTSYQGQLQVLGMDPYRQRNALMNEVCFIADVALLPRWLRVNEAIDFVSGVHPRFDRTKCEGFLERTQLPRRARVRELSKGMIVQLHLALVMAIDARLLVLDEPTLGLDILYRKQFYRHLQEYYFDEQRTILITTHQIEEIEHILTDVMFIRDGHLVLNTDVQNLAKRYTQVLVDTDKLDSARALGPIDEHKQSLSHTIMLFDGIPKDQLAPLGTTSTPSLADLFVAVMNGTYA
ncbi:ABC transporter ATP-binding protein [Xylella fastidiosa subsp. multiplex]|uniref:ABC transporter ATP-binding protein n=1 Tax=Xylella fastidiosa TaxID=2371 RepID=UPI0035D4B57B